VPRIIEVIHGDVSPPLYYLLLNQWIAAFGDSEFALRSMSAVAATLGLVLMALTAWSVTRSRLGTLVATALYAASVLQVQYAQEARSYGLASLLALLAFYAMAKRLQSHWLWLLLALIGCIGSVYLHNMMWFYLLGLNIVYLLLPGPVKFWRRVAELAVLDSLTVAAYMPWLPALLDQIAWLNGNFWAMVPTFDDLAQTLLAAAGVKRMHLNALLPGRPAGWGIALVLVALIAVALVRKEQRRWALGILVFGLLPIGAVFVYAHVRQSFFVEKVFTASTIAIPLTAAVAVSGKGAMRWLGLLLSMAVLAGSVGSTYGYFRWEQKEDWRTATDYLNYIPRSSTLVVFVANEGEYLYEYYTRRSGSFGHQMTGAPQGFFDIDPPKTIQRVLRPEDLATLAKRLEEQRPKRVVLVLSHTHFSDPNDLTRRFLEKSMRCFNTQEFNQLAILQYTR
jgi:4-amino-4-deoxy-L-arabinose transferase-like glycosyltransferase